MCKPGVDTVNRFLTTLRAVLYKARDEWECIDRIPDFCWHDLRHTWASSHVQNGTPLHVLQELGGWASIKMVQRYAHLSGEHLRAWVEKPALTLVVNNVSRTGTEG